MKSKIFQLLGVLYVTFAILLAHSALVTPQKAIEDCSQHASEVAPSTGALFDHQRLDNSDKETPKTPEIDRSEYKVVVWSARWCASCRVYKAVEVPKLLKKGYQVEIKSFDSDKPPEAIRFVPTVQLYHGDTLLDTRIYWSYAEVEKYVINRMSLKG
jgi:hypothetical protein